MEQPIHFTDHEAIRTGEHLGLRGGMCMTTPAIDAVRLIGIVPYLACAMTRSWTRMIG